MKKDERLPADLILHMLREAETEKEYKELLALLKGPSK